MEFEKLYMFNPFNMSSAKSEDIAETYKSLQGEIINTPDTPVEISKNIELYANMNYLIGEMIARITEEYDTLKVETSIKENKKLYETRQIWKENNDEKAPAMSYFEAIAKESVQKELKELAELGARLFRFKKAYESIESKQNALKKRIESIKYEL